jgi:copper chaperone CopZ
VDHDRTALPLADNGGGCACCSTPTTKTERPTSKENSMSTQTFPVTGMTCGHCVSAVTSELKAIPGVTDVSVDLVAGGTSSVTVDSEQPVETAAVEAALDEAGDYQLA